ncbi:hypothetical protein YB2330_003822 [Saitoella coloradoensis]
MGRRRNNKDDDDLGLGAASPAANESADESPAPVVSKSAAKKDKRNKKKAAQVQDDSDDDKFDLKPETPEEEEESEEEIKPAPKKKGKAAKKAAPPPPKNAFDMLEDDDVEEEEEEEEEANPVSKSKKASKVSKNSKKSKSKKAVESEDEEEEEEDEEDEPVQKARSAFDALDIEDEDEDEEEEEKEEEKPKKSKSKKSSSKKSMKSADDEDDEEESGEKKPKKEKKDRKERRKEKLAKKMKTAMGPGSDEEKEPEVKNEVFLNSKAAYGYASGSNIGPEGQNPADAIAITGNLLSPPNSRDVQIEKLTLQAFGKTLIKESNFSLINGRRYGVIAPNGSGKSTLMHAIACGLLPVPPALDFYLLDREFGPTDLTSIEAVLDINERERKHLEEEMDDLLDDPDKNAVRLDWIQTRLTELEIDGSDRQAKAILTGLGFSEERMNTKTKDLSGGWRMRISLARILFVKPTLMMLDEPTNHLDLEAVAWLEEYLLHEIEGHTLMIISHSMDTLNEVCTDIIHLYHQHLDFYNGNYDTFVRVREEKTAQLTKRSNTKEKEMAKLQQKLNKTGSKEQQQAKSKVKAMEKKFEKDKAKDATLEEELIQDRELNLKFTPCGGGIPAPAIKFREVDFAYPDQPTLLHDMNFGLDLSSRVALVGPNGAGKTTLIKLILGKLEATTGTISKHHHLRLAHFHQHMGDQLNLEMSAVDWLRIEYGERGVGDMRKWVGKFGLTGKSQVVAMKQLSDGQRRRVLFAYLGLKNPHMILFDEPTNALDLDTIDALAEAINEFDGGVVIISHDFRLIEQVAEEVWIVDKGKVEEFDGDIRDYKNMLKQHIRDEREQRLLEQEK